MRDLTNNIKLVNALPPQVIATTTSTSIIDLLGFNSVAFSISSGAITDGSYVVSAMYGDAADLSDGEFVGPTDLLVSMPSFTSTDDNKVKKVGFIGNHRYIRLTITPTGASTGGLFSVVAVLGRPANAPVA